MKNLVFYPDFADYKQSIFDMFQDKDLISHPFYQNLVLFVCDHRSPNFYDISHTDEHFAFSGAYHWMTRRHYQGNVTRQSIFFMHDFTHLLFYYPHDTRQVSLEEFTDNFIYQERIASSETEVMSYYRVEGLRDKVFDDEFILFDALGPDRPDPVEFFRHRNNLINIDDYGQEHLGQWPQLLSWMRSWRRLTPQWCEKRYLSLQEKIVPQYDWLTLELENYEDVITNYVHIPSQERYEQNILRNLNMAYALLGLDNPPKGWEQAEFAFAQLNDKVLVR